MYCRKENSQSYVDIRRKEKDLWRQSMQELMIPEWEEIQGI